jgi:hypothetical protein
MHPERIFEMPGAESRSAERFTNKGSENETYISFGDAFFHGRRIRRGLRFP